MIWGKAFRENWWKIAGVFFFMELNLALSILFYPDFMQQFAVWSKIAIVANVPVVKDLLRMAGESEFPGYLLMQHFFKGMNVLGSVGAVLLGMGVVAKEVENRTFEVLLSRPISRFKILFSNFAVAGGLLVVAVFCSSVSAFFLGKSLLNESLPMSFLLLSSIHSSLFLILLYVLTVFVSACMSEQTKVAFIMAGAIVGMFLIYFVQSLHEYSMFQLMDPRIFLAINKSGQLPYFLDACLLGGIVLVFGLAQYRFKTRDF